MTDRVITSLKQALLKYKLETQAEYDDQSRWLVGFSGGLDSMVLVHALSQLIQDPQFIFDYGYRQNNQATTGLPEVLLVHVNHGLSPNAHDWARFCQSQAERLGLICLIKELDSQVFSMSNIEEQARNARYQAFAEELCIKDHENSQVLTAHHGDDQVETFLYRFSRGSGVKGLSSMRMHQRLRLCVEGVPKAKPQTISIVRPLLNIPRLELENYAKHHDLDWVEDESNSNELFDRNAIRHKVLAPFKQIKPNIIERGAANIQRLQAAEDLLKWQAENDIETVRELFYSYPSLSLTKIQDWDLASQRLANCLPIWLEQELDEHCVLSEGLMQDLVQACLKPSQAFEQLLMQSSMQLSMALVIEQEHLCLLPQELVLSCREGKLKRVEQVGQQTGLSIEFPDAQFSWGGHYYRISSNAFDVKQLDSLIVTSRVQGEVLVLGGQHKKVKKLLQQLKLPFWEKEKLPFVYQGGELKAIGIVLTCDDWQAKGISLKTD